MAQGLGMGQHPAYIPQGGPGQAQQVLGHRQVVHPLHIAARVGHTKVQCLGHVPGLAVFKGQHPMGRLARLHRREHPLEGGAGQSPGMGEKPG